MKRFVALWDTHFGYERRGGHKVPLHDPRAIDAVLQFVDDFEPDHVILGGDILDCGAISHHNKNKPGATEGLRILSDAAEVRETLIEPLETTGASLTYIKGNHEGWLDELVESQPGLEGIVDLRAILKLGKRWKVIEEGGAHTLDKMVFLHGDQVKGGQNPAKWAVDAYGRNVFFGHHHTHQAYTKVSALDLNGHTGTAVPCLCKKGPKYGGGSPNRWMQGFLYGYTDGKAFNAYVAIIINGKFFAEGKAYSG